MIWTLPASTRRARSISKLQVRVTAPDADLLVMIRADRLEAYDTSEPSLLVPVSSLDLPASPWEQPMAWLGRELLYAQTACFACWIWPIRRARNCVQETTMSAQPSGLRLEGNRLLLLRPSSSSIAESQFQIGHVDPQGAVELQTPIITSFRFQDVTLCRRNSLRR